MCFLNICNNQKAVSVKSVSDFFKNTSSSQVPFEIGQNPLKMERILAYSRSDLSILDFLLGAEKKTFCSPVTAIPEIFVIF